MNIDKMAEFLKSLREEKGLTQDQLGEMLNVSRSLISKWENGNKIPAVDCLTSLAKVYDITIDEIIYGARKNKENASDIETLSATIMNDSKKRIDLAHRVIFGFIGLVIFLVFGFYFIFNYNSIKVYSVGGQNDIYDVKNTLMIISKNESYIKFGDIVNLNNPEEDYDKYEFYAKDGDTKIVLSTREDGALLRNFDDQNNFLNFKNLGKYIDYLYVDVYKDEEVETIKLDTTLEMANNKIININKSDGSSIKKTKITDHQAINLPAVFNGDYNYDEDNNLYVKEVTIKNDKLRFEYNSGINVINIISNNIRYTYDFSSEYLSMSVYENNKYSRIATYDIKNDQCMSYDCENIAEYVENFKNNYYELIKK